MMQGYHDPFWSAHGMETYTQKDQVGGRKTEKLMQLFYFRYDIKELCIFFLSF